MPSSRFLEVLNALFMEENYGQYTTARHTCSFESVDVCYANKMMGLFRKSKINFIVWQTENMHLRGSNCTKCL
ncbi:hypothetical protein [Staphylococcus kloosii]|uniref:hypothetical protein n=1 Tax=Staphylococcus kloosii TaxID=29384 RepID=UPI0028A408A3|nr:hypothetical protein [Staphylococcus kloosii]MDT3959867.1 hypothetical protein [Staphylococcus kloosii]